MLNGMVRIRTVYNIPDIIFHECLTHGDMIFHIGDAVELLSSSKQIPTEGDYKACVKEKR